MIGDISGSMNDMRGMMSDVRGGFLGIIGSVFGKIENLMSQFQHIIIRMRTLLARVVGIMMSFMYIFYGGMQTGESVVAGPIGKTMSVLCFDENTMIPISSGLVLPMKDLIIGDILVNDNAVTSVYKINGKNVQMYLLDGIKVSGGHKVWYKRAGKFISVSQHPLAIATSESQNLVCINTENKSFKIGDFYFLDFTEVGDVTGVSEDTIIALKSLDVSISEVILGDVLLGNDIVRGIVKHLIDDKIRYNLITEESIISPNNKVEILN